MKLTEISREVVATSPVFIVGLPRCGTSILFRTFLRHPSFKSINLNLWETKIFSLANRSYLLGSEEQVKRALIHYMMLDEVRYNEFLESIRIIRVLQRIMNIDGIPEKVVNKAEWAKRLWWIINQNHLVFRSFFCHAQMARKCGRIVEKSPTNVRHIPEIMLTFPKAKLICVYRHPVDAYTSYKKRLMEERNLGKEEAHLRWLTLFPIDFCEEYKEAINAILGYKKRHRESLFLMEYESFVDDPKKEFSKICEFIDEQFEEGATEVGSDLSEMNQNFDLNIFGAINARTKNWKEYITIEEAEYIEKELEGTIQQLGYVRYT